MVRTALRDWIDLINSCFEVTSEQREYFAVEKPASKLQRRLSRTWLPAERADACQQLADIERRLADMHPIAFGPDPIPDEGGRDLAEAHLSSARLLRLVAEAELARASARPRRWTGPAELETAGAPALNRIADPGDSDRRGALDELYDAVVDEVGGQAAETIACLGVPRPWRRLWERSMLCPRCVAFLGRETRTGKPDVYYHCRRCGIDWAEE